VICGWLVWTNQKLSRTAALAPAQRTMLWSYLFDQQRETTIVCADSTLVVAEGLLHRSVTMDEYMSRDYMKADGLPEEAQRVLRGMPNWVFTDLADVRLVQRLFRLNADNWTKVTVRSAKMMQIHDFTAGNHVLLGSNRSNVWNHLFEPQLNFRFDYDDDDHVASVRNVNPAPGEQPFYRAALPGKSGDCYSLVALVPNLRHSGHVLMIGGTTAEGTESAGEFMMNPNWSSGFLATLTQRNHGRLPYFEALLRSGTFSGIAKNAEVIAYRILPGGPAND